MLKGGCEFLMKKGSFIYKGKLISWFIKVVGYSNGKGRLNIYYKTKRCQLFSHTVECVKSVRYERILKMLDSYTEEQLNQYVENRIINNIEFREKKKRWS